ncbi:hypothetical protein U0355_10650 [Salimicrobium sp. PL1-032A]|uniref:hypothetical protein n=1 Tax=Salimicrobium sp. PL1-032A TaxID=3095364 RepID=UPI003261D471
MEKVTLLGEEKIEEKELPGLIYKQLKPTLRMKRGLDERTIRDGITRVEKRYHPMWVIKMLIIAERKPFPPKVTPNMVFVDGRSGYRGLFTTVPPRLEKEVGEHEVLRPFFSKQEMLGKYVKDVQEKQINRKYVLKKPKYDVKEMDLLYLPIWQVEVKNAHVDTTYWVNGNTGESEELLMKLCESQEWML